MQLLRLFFGTVWEVQIIFGTAWEVQIIFGTVWEVQIIFGTVWEAQIIFGTVWEVQIIFWDSVGDSDYFLGQCERFRTVEENISYLLIY